MFKFPPPPEVVTHYLEKGSVIKSGMIPQRGETPMSNVESFQIDLEQEDDGRWIGEIAALPGVIAYGPTRETALVAVQALALRVLADRLDHGEAVPDELMNVSFVGA
jgi:predicted RNase H-like HicB family nuclease